MTDTPDLSRIAAAAAADHLAVLGAVHPDPGGPAGDAGTLILLSPAEPGFWPAFTAGPEWRDGAPDPLDRWSARVIGALAAQIGARALFPSDGPPWLPFYDWALATGSAWASPVRLLVHGQMGLWASCRGVLAIPDRIDLPAAVAPSPCLSCATQPCLTACPVAALAGAGYDTAACHRFLDTPPGESCMSQGCAVRRACPAGAGYGRLPEQSAYHMSCFHP